MKLQLLGSIAVLVACACTPSVAQSRFDPRPKVPFTGGEDEATAKGLVDAWSAANGFHASESVAQQMGSQLGNFKQMFCDPGNEKAIVESCKRLSSSTSELTSVANAFLDDVASQRPTILSFYARLAKAIGKSSTDTGWPEKEPNNLHASLSKSQSATAAKFEEILPDWDWYCLNGPRIKLESGDVRGGRLPQATLSPPATSPILEVDLIGLADFCQQDCLVRLERTVVQATALWRSACKRCAPNAASIIRVNGRPYASISLARKILGGTDPSPLSLNRPSYVPLTSDQAAAACKATASPEVCSATKSPTTVRVTFTSSDTPCGSPSDVIACAQVEGDVLLSLGSFTYRDSKGAMFGKGPEVDIGEILLHEIGHWFGLPHATGAPDESRRTNIMGDEFNPAGMCVRTENMMMLDNAVDVKGEQRAKGCMGLRYPRPKNPQTTSR